MCPHPVAFSTYKMCIDLCACAAMLTICVLYVSFGSSVTPNIFGCVFMGSVVLPIYRCSLVLYSTGFGVNSVHIVLSGLSMSLLYSVHV